MASGISDEQRETQEPPPGAVAQATRWARAKASWAMEWTLGARESHRSVDLGFRLADRDKRVAAGVLAGGVAYRMFFWLASLSVLATGALGVADGQWLEEYLLEMGVSRAATDVVIDALRGTDEARWWLLLVGGWLVMWTGYLGAKTLVLVHAAVWGLPTHQSRKPWVMSLVFSGTVLSFVASMSVADRVHARGGGEGIVATVLLAAIPFGIWLIVSRILPNAATGWRDLVPGALLVGLGVQAFYQIATVILIPRLANATELYGLLGITATALFWLYVLGRMMIGAATLNVSVCEQRSAAAPHRRAD